MLFDSDFQTINQVVSRLVSTICYLIANIVKSITGKLWIYDVVKTWNSIKTVPFSNSIMLDSCLIGEGRKSKLRDELLLAFAEETSTVVIMLDGAKGMLIGLLARASTWRRHNLMKIIARLLSRLSFPKSLQ